MMYEELTPLNVIKNTFSFKNMNVHFFFQVKSCVFLTTVYLHLVVLENIIYF